MLAIEGYLDPMMPMSQITDFQKARVDSERELVVMDHDTGAFDMLRVIGFKDDFPFWQFFDAQLKAKKR